MNEAFSVAPCRALIYKKNRFHELAIQDCSELIRLCPNDPDAYRLRGSCYALLGEYALAAIDYERAIELKIEDPDIEEDLITAYSHINK
ncbi:MAG: tetratricopeptide repeat protein [Syntrophobacteraceae bacterium]